MGPANDKYQSSTYGLKPYARAVVESEAWPNVHIWYPLDTLQEHPYEHMQRAHNPIIEQIVDLPSTCIEIIYGHKVIGCATTFRLKYICLPTESSCFMFYLSVLYGSPGGTFLLITYYLLLITYHLLLITYYLLLTTYHLLLTTYYLSYHLSPL